MTEHQLLNQIIVYAKRLGLLAHHNYDGWDTTEPGAPDLEFCGPGGYLRVELKVKGRTLSLQQARYRRALRQAGIPVAVWTEDDWHCGIVQRELVRLSEPSAKAA